MYQTLPAPAFYYPSYPSYQAVLQPPGTGGVPHPLYGQHHAIPSVPGASHAYPAVPMTAPGYPQVAHAGTTSMGPVYTETGSAFSATTLSSHISSGFGPIHRPVTMQLSVPVPSPISFDRMSSEQSLPSSSTPSTEDSSVRSTSTTSNSNPATPFSSLGSAPSMHYDHSGSEQQQAPSMATSTSVSSTASDTTLSLASLPLRVGSLTSETLPQQPITVGQQLRRLSLENEDGAASSYQPNDPFTAAVIFDSAYPASPSNSNSLMPSPSPTPSSYSSPSGTMASAPVISSSFNESAATADLDTISTPPPPYPASLSSSCSSRSLHQSPPASAAPSTEHRAASPPPLYSGFAPASRYNLPLQTQFGSPGNSYAISRSPSSATMYPAASAPAYPGVTVDQPAHASGASSPDLH